MQERVGTSPNNWVQVEKIADDRFVAGVGAETFEVKVDVALATGQILAATMVNPVEVLERTCADAGLSNCGAATRYQIMRRISLLEEGIAPAQPVVYGRTFDHWDSNGTRR